MICIFNTVSQHLLTMLCVFDCVKKKSRPNTKASFTLSMHTTLQYNVRLPNLIWLWCLPIWVVTVNGFIKIEGIFFYVRIDHKSMKMKQRKTQRRQNRAKSIKKIGFSFVWTEYFFALSLFLFFCTWECDANTNYVRDLNTIDFE